MGSRGALILTCMALTVPAVAWSAARVGVADNSPMLFSHPSVTSDGVTGLGVLRVRGERMTARVAVASTALAPFTEASYPLLGVSLARGGCGAAPGRQAAIVPVHVRGRGLEFTGRARLPEALRSRPLSRIARSVRVVLDRDGDDAAEEVACASVDAAGTKPTAGPFTHILRPIGGSGIDGIAMVTRSRTGTLRLRMVLVDHRVEGYAESSARLSLSTARCGASGGSSLAFPRATGLSFTTTYPNFGPRDLAARARSVRLVTWGDGGVIVGSTCAPL